MRMKVLACAIAALAFLIPAVPAQAQASVPGLDANCQLAERLTYHDLRALVTIDLNTATDIAVRLLANQILAQARADALPRLPETMQARLDGSAEDLRSFLKTGMEVVWADDVRVRLAEAMSVGGPKVKEAAGKAMDEGTIEAVLAFLNDGLYAARELDCQAQATPTPTSTASASSSPSESPVPSGELAKTGESTAILLYSGATLLVLGVGAVLLARRSRV